MSKKTISKLIAVIIFVVIVVVAGILVYLLTLPPAPVPDYIKIGWPLQMTGAEAALTEAFPWVVQKIEKTVNEEGGVYIAEYGKKIPVKVILRDTKSDPDLAATLAEELITKEEVHILIASFASHAFPVSVTAERYRVPTVIAFAIVRGWLKGAPYKWAFLPSWSEPEAEKYYIDTWRLILKKETAIVGAIWTDDPAGRGFREAFLAIAGKAGFRIVDAGLVPRGTVDFRPYIETWKREGVEILRVNMIPPDFAALWRQCREVGFIPKIASVGRAIMFPPQVEALGGDLPLGLTTEVAFSPSWPYRSTLLGLTAKELCEIWEKESGRPWTQPMGQAVAVFEIILDSIKRAGSLDKTKIRDAIAETDITTIIGPVNFKKPPTREMLELFAGFPEIVENWNQISSTPHCVGQWLRGTTRPWELRIIYSGDFKEIPVEAEPKTIPELLGMGA